MWFFFPPPFNLVAKNSFARHCYKLEVQVVLDILIRLMKQFGSAVLIYSEIFFFFLHNLFFWQTTRKQHIHWLFSASSLWTLPVHYHSTSTATALKTERTNRENHYRNKINTSVKNRERERLRSILKWSRLRPNPFWMWCYSGPYKIVFSNIK